MNTQRDNQEVECQQVREALSAHFDGVANNAEQQLATAHLAHCSACAQMWQHWQSLRLMEQRALEPLASDEILPLAPVKTPRHLKSKIIRQTVATPIWQRFWPRLLTGMAVPTFALGCWLLIVAAPQQSIPEITTPLNSTPEKRVAIIPNVSTKTKRTTVSTTAKSRTLVKSKTTLSSPQTESRAVSSAPVSRIKHSAHMASFTHKKYSSKSTFKAVSPSEDPSEESILAKTPQISLASFDRPHSRAVKPTLAETAKPEEINAPKPRITVPPQVDNLSAQTTTLVAQADDDNFNPVLEYIAANDLRPKDIRQAVENYRAALLDYGSDL